MSGRFKDTYIIVGQPPAVPEPTCGATITIHINDTYTPMD